MTKYEYNNTQYEFPDTMSEQDALRLMSADHTSQGTQNTANGGGSDATSHGGLSKLWNGHDPSTLVNDKKWVNAVKTYYAGTMNHTFNGDDKAASEWGLNHMAWFNNNIFYMGVDAATLAKQPKENQQAFLTMMDTFDDTRVSFAGIGRAVTPTLTDPMNLASAETMGLSALGGLATKQVTKEALKQLLTSNVKRFAMRGLVENAAQNAAYGSVKQDVEITTGRQKEFSYLQLATDAAFGAVVGTVVGGTVGGVVGGAKYVKGQMLPDLPTTPVPNGTSPPVPGGGGGVAPSVQPNEHVFSFTQDNGLTDNTGRHSSLSTNADDIGNIDLTTLPAVPSGKTRFFTTDGKTFSIDPVYAKGMKEDGELHYVDLSNSHSYVRKAKVDASGNVGEGVFPGITFTDKAKSGAQRVPTLSGEIGSLSAKEHDFLSQISDFARFSGDVVDYHKELGLYRADMEARKAGATWSFMDPSSPRAKEIVVEPGGERTVQRVKGVTGPVTEGERDALKAMKAAYKRAGSPFNPQEVLDDIRATTDKFDKHDPFEHFSDPSGAPRPSTGSIMDAIRTSAAGKDILKGIIPKTRDDVSRASSVATRLLENVPRSEIKQTVEQLLTKATTPEQRQLFNDMFRQLTQQLLSSTKLMHEQWKSLPDGPNKNSMFRELMKWESIRDNVREADIALSSMEGRDLASRQGMVNTNEFREKGWEDTIIESWGHKDPSVFDEFSEVRLRAKEEFYLMYGRKMEAMNNEVKVRELTEQIQKLVEEGSHKSGNMTRINALVSERAILKDLLVKAELEGLDGSWIENQMNKAREYGFHRLPNTINSFFISNVFSPATTFINFVPTLFNTVSTPALMWVNRGGVFDKAATKSMLTFYHTMYNNIGNAWQMSRIAGEYSRALMADEKFKFFDDNGKYLLQDSIDGLSNGYVRKTLRWGEQALKIFPNILVRTDELMTQLNYRGYHMAEAHYNAIEAAKHLPAKEQEKYIKNAMKEAAANMFGPVENSADIIHMFQREGKRKGLEGSALNKYVSDSVKTKLKAFAPAKDGAAFDYAENARFAGEFSGTNIASKAARKYEEFVNEVPWLRFLGQPFFRTPVRVVEMGVRSTPLMGLAAPRMISDLYGANGLAKQARAQALVHIGMAFTGLAVVKFAAGEFTSSAPEDPKARAEWLAAGNKEYSIKFGDTWYKYGRFDPIATPLRVAANIMQNLKDVSIRQAQGEFADDDKHEEMFAGAVVAMVTAIETGIQKGIWTDASLFQGVHDVTKAFEGIVNPEKYGDNVPKYFGKKLQGLVPFSSTISKGQAVAGKDETPDPVTMEQFWNAKLNVSNPTLPHKFDPLGAPIRNTNPKGGLFGFLSSDENEAKTNYKSFYETQGKSLGLHGNQLDEYAEERSTKALFVAKELNALTVATGTGFAIPKKDPFLPGIEDLRKEVGKSAEFRGQNLYDVANKLLAQSNLVDRLYVVLGSKAPTGTRKYNGPKEEEVSKAFKEAYQQVFLYITSKEVGLNAELVKERILRDETRAGKHDTPIVR